MTVGEVCTVRDMFKELEEELIELIGDNQKIHKIIWDKHKKLHDIMKSEYSDEMMATGDYSLL